MPPLVIRILVLVSVLSAAAGCAPRPPAAENVLLVLIDTVRSDHLSVYGYPRETTPNLDALAAGGAVFLRHYSQGSHTRAAMPSLLYSRYFAKPLFSASSRVPLSSPSEMFQKLDEAALALPTAMSDAGRRTVLINTHPWLQPRTELARLYDEVHHLRGEASGEMAAERRGRPQAAADQMVERAIRWLTKRDERPFFMHLHLMDVHEPLYATEDAVTFLPQGVGAFPADWSDVRSDREVLTGSERDRLVAAYDGALRAVDRELGRLFDFLRAERLLETTVVVVTSDHGEALFERGARRGHGGPMYEGVARVPLILHFPPRVPPMRAQLLSESVDVAATIFALTDVMPPTDASVDGVDLLGGDLDAKERAVMGPTFIRQGRFKLLLSSTAGSALGSRSERRVRGELYDLESDPREATDLWEQRPEVVADLLDAYRNTLEAPYRRFVSARADVQPESGFAVAVEHFELGAKRSLPSRPSEVDPADLAPGWSVDRVRRREALRSAVVAEPLDVRLSIPSGHYRLLLDGWGRLGVMVNPDGGCGARGEPRRFDQPPGDAQRQPLGEIEVCEARLHLRLVPSGETRVRYLGFQPLGVEAAAGLDDPERDRQLEALGYIN